MGNDNNVGMYTGAAKTAKYTYQASRGLQSLGTTTRLTAAVDVLTGGIGLGTAEALQSGATAAGTTAKGVVGAAKVSRFAQVAGVAGKVAPALTKGCAVLGAAVGGYEMGTGINNIANGNTAKGKEQVLSGSMDVLCSGALAVAATSSGTVVGLPVAGVALGVAAVSQGVKYGYKYRNEIASGAKWAGNKVAQGAGYAGRGIASGAKAVGRGAAVVGNTVADGAVAAGRGISRAAGAAADAVSSGWNKLCSVF